MTANDQASKRNGLDQEVDAALSQLLTELKSCPVPKRIEDLAKQLQTLIDSKRADHGNSEK